MSVFNRWGSHARFAARRAKPAAAPTKRVRSLVAALFSSLVPRRLEAIRTITKECIRWVRGDKISRRSATVAAVMALMAASSVALAPASSVALAPASSAGGTSGKVHGCYGKWWNTAFAGYCSPATATGHFRLRTSCKAAGDYTGTWRKITKDSTIEPFDRGECRYGVHHAWVEFKS